MGIVLSAAVRRYSLQEEGNETFQVPLDVKVEVLAGLALCILGTMAIFTTNLLIISGLYFYENK